MGCRYLIDIIFGASIGLGASWASKALICQIGRWVYCNAKLQSLFEIAGAISCVEIDLVEVTARLELPTTKHIAIVESIAGVTPLLKGSSIVTPWIAD